MSRPTLLLIMTILALSAAGISGYVWFSHHRRPPSLGPIETITLGANWSLLSAPIWIAEHQGYFRDAGLEVTIKEFPTGRAAFLAMLHGEPLDIITVGATAVMVESFSRDDFRIIATFVDSDASNAVIANKDSGIATITDLRGKKIGYMKGSSAHFLLEMLLVEHGLVPTQVELVSVTPADGPTALAQRYVDAIAIWEPYATQALELLHERAVQLAPPGTYRATYNFVAMHGFIHQRPQVVMRFLTAIERANRLISDQRDAAQTIAADRLRLDRALVAKLWGQYSYRLFLDQLFVLDLESQARWAIKSHLTDKTVVPNYLHLIALDGLQRVSPKAVTLVLPRH
jgi:ABC-type nitrate/sulfonate/bicarbonate transport system substrate-binding protein